MNFLAHDLIFAHCSTFQFTPIVEMLDVQLSRSWSFFPCHFSKLWLVMFKSGSTRFWLNYPLVDSRSDLLQLISDGPRGFYFVLDYYYFQKLLLP